jgi:hypothetical protein
MKPYTALDNLVSEILHATMDHGEQCCVKFESECIGHETDNTKEFMYGYVKQRIEEYMEANSSAPRPSTDRKDDK